MKYEKPIARNLGDFSIAAGLCTSGTSPDQACRGGFTNLGPCGTGTTAGHACAGGNSPDYNSSCAGGAGASACGTGGVAAIDMPIKP
jgi:hypothetical protein